jgi:GT2 family glycosyltransferase
VRFTTASVVLPTLDRRPALLRTLHAFGDQQLRGIEMELVVVDNGSSDGTPDAVEEVRQSLPVPVRLVRERRQGVSAARNAGVAVASGELIIFANDDTRPADRNLVAGHVAAHGASEGPGVVAGRIEYEPADAGRPLMRWLNQGAQFAYGGLTAGPIAHTYLYTAHASMARQTLLDVGGMDDRIVYGYEDAVLGIRLADAGIPLVYHPELLLLHDHPMSLRTWRDKATRNGAAGYHVNATMRRTPPVARVPAGPRWWLVRAAAPLLARDSVERLVQNTPLAHHTFKVVHAGSFAAGYHRARRDAERD